MKIKRTDLINHLKMVIPGVETGNSILDGADTFVFTEDGIFSYNDSISVSIPMKTGIKGAVKSKEFFSLLQKLKEEDITIIQKEDHLIVKCGNTRANIRLVKSSILKYLEKLELNDLKWIELDDSFIHTMKLCKLNLSNSPYRGIYVNKKVMLSTDEIRIVRADLKGDYPRFWIDDPSVNELLKLPTSLVSMAISYGWVHFEGKDGTTFSCKTNDSDRYPEKALSKHIGEADKKKGDPSGKLPQDFREVVDRVSVLSEDLQGFSVINLEFTTEQLIVSSEREAGSVSEGIPWDLKIKKEVSTSADAGFLIEAAAKSPDFYITSVGEATFIIFTDEGFTLLLHTIK